MRAATVRNVVKRLFRATLIAGVFALGLASLLIHPFGAVKGSASIKPLLDGAKVSSDVARVFERSCQNCHSEKTRWPWYSYVAPMSWLIERDVRDARSHMNLSRWAEYSIEKKQELLADLGVAVRNRQMPPARYLFLHPSDRLSNVERDGIYQWARGERRRLRTAAAAHANASGD